MLKPLTWIGVSLFASWCWPSPPIELAAASALYEEDAAARRPVAAMQARLLRIGGEVRLELRVLAVAAGIVPVPGLDGAPGANLRTAIELDRLLGDQAIVLRSRIGERLVNGSLLTIESGPVPLAAVDAAGNRAPATSPASWPVAATFRSAPLPQGSSRSLLEVDGVPRLLVDVTHGPGHATIDRLMSLGEHTAEGW